MLDYLTVEKALESLSHLPMQGEVGNWQDRIIGIYRALDRAKVEMEDFREACDIINDNDQWYPVPKRLIDVAYDCRAERHARNRALSAGADTPTLVCPYCTGARWVRLGGFSPPKTRAGSQPGDRIQPCPHCTVDGRYAAGKEQALIAAEGGVLDPAYAPVPTDR